MLKSLLGSAGLAIAAVTVALSATPAPAQAQSGSTFCVDFDGVMVGPGELVRRVDGRNPRRIYTRVYLCRDDGRLGFLYQYCEGPDCWPWEGRPPIQAFDYGDCVWLDCSHEEDEPPFDWPSRLP